MQDYRESVRASGDAPNFRDDPPSGSAPAPGKRGPARLWAALWRLTLRSLIALILARLCMFATVAAWSFLPYGLEAFLHDDPVYRDTLFLAIPLAARSVALGCLWLVLGPLMLAAWAGGCPLSRRVRAVLNGVGAGLLTVLVWQTAGSLGSGYGFILRHSVPHPVTIFDLTGLAFACLAGVWATLRVIPIRKAGGLYAWALPKR